MRIILLITCLIAISLSNCNPTTDCPPINKAIFEWLPYKLNDTVILCNQQGDMLTFMVTGSNFHHQKSYSKNTDCAICNTDYQVILTNDSSIMELSFSTYYGTNGEFKLSYYLKNGTSKFFKNYEKQPDSITFGNTTYKDLITFEFDSTNTNYYSPAYKIIVSRQYGIVAIYEQKTGIIWVACDKRILKLGTEDVTVKYSSC